NQLLVEQIHTREGYHLFMYPLEGRLVHEVMATVIAYRISKRFPISFSIAMNDYGFELFSDQPIPVDLEFLTELFQLDRLMDDVVASINAAEMALHKFRDIARSEERRVGKEGSAGGAPTAEKTEDTEDQ